MAGLRVVLDTNVVVSGLAYPASIPGSIVSACRQGMLDVVVSRFILEEVRRILPRLTRIRLSADEVRDLTDAFMFLTDVVEPDTSTDPELRDGTDQQILATFRAAQARYLITGDKDLLALAHRYPIVTPAWFWARHGG
ncbi:MAG: putative toxin-antitoxin system toxin component, PIN family [Acidobacteriaceae bacterium]